MKKLADYETSHFNYDPTTGLITNTKNGKVYTKNAKTGYVSIGLTLKVLKKSTMVFAHRLAWYLYNGEEPNIIDHANGVRDDNRIGNLISTTVRGNGQNRKRNRNSKYLPGAKKTRNGFFESFAVSILTGNLAYIGSYSTEIYAHYVSTFYKQTHYVNYQGNDLTDIDGLPHPFFAGQLADIVASIKDTKGKSALNFIHK